MSSRKKRKRRSKYLYPIGTYILIHRSVTTRLDNNEIEEDGHKYTPNHLLYKRYKPPKIGIICGMKHLREGQRVQDIEIDDENGGSWWEPPYFLCTKSHQVYLVRLGMLNKPLMVLPEDLESIKELPEDYIFPMLYQNTGSWTKEDKEICKQWPRGSDGKWIPEREAPFLIGKI